MKEATTVMYGQTGFDGLDGEKTTPYGLTQQEIDLVFQVFSGEYRRECRAEWSYMNDEELLEKYLAGALK